MQPTVEFIRKRKNVFFLTCNGQEVRYDIDRPPVEITFNWRGPKRDQEIFVFSLCGQQVYKWSARYRDETGDMFYPCPSAEEMARINAVNDFVIKKIATGHATKRV